MDQIDDEFLGRLASAGDGAALATLLCEHEAQLLQYVTRRLPPAMHSFVDPADIVQETSYEACRMIRGFVADNATSFTRWLRHIANYRIKYWIKKYRSRRSHAVSARMGESTSVLSALEHLRIYRRTPSTSAAAHELVLKVEQSLERIHKNYRQVLIHRFLEGLSVEETSLRMNRDVNAVYVLCSRALGALRDELSVSQFV